MINQDPLSAPEFTHSSFYPDMHISSLSGQYDLGAVHI